jgi:ABC-type lipoprotein release transport system permease subunit
MLWRIAWRNLWRHKARTFIMASAVSFTYGLTLASLGLNEYSHARMLDEALRAAGGDVLIHGDGFWATRASDAVIGESDDVVQRVEAVDGVTAVMPRILITGLVSTSAGARPVFLQGIDPALELPLRDVAQDLVAGGFTAPGRTNPIVLGSRIVDKLELEIGDRVVLTASRPDGEVTRALFHLTGISEAGMRELDEVLGITTIDAARRAVEMPGMLSQIGIVSADGEQSFALAAAVEEALGERAADLEVLPWQEAVPEMVGFVEIDDAFGIIYMVIIFVVVLFSITNTFLMAVMERVRELGLLSALGLRGNIIGRLLLSETVLLTALAMTVGFALGYGGHLAASHWGISLSMYGLEEIEISGIDMADLVIYSTINPTKWIFASVLVAGASIAAAVYPAWRASRLAPAEAMRFYE